MARERLDDKERAEAVCRWILDVDGSDRKALGDLDALYEAQARWAERSWADRSCRIWGSCMT